MDSPQELLAKIKELVGARQYRIRLHAVRHMIEEGFSEENILEALIGRSSILEDYPDELRCLILGYFKMSDKVRSPLHVVCDYSSDKVVDVVTPIYLKNRGGLPRHKEVECYERINEITLLRV